MLLDVKSVDKKFNGVYALKGLDFSLGEGEYPVERKRSSGGDPTGREPEAGDQHYLSGQRPDPGIYGNGKYLSRKTLSGKRRADPMERDGTGSRGESGGAWDPS